MAARETSLRAFHATVRPLINNRTGLAARLSTPQRTVVAPAAVESVSVESVAVSGWGQGHGLPVFSYPPPEFRGDIMNCSIPKVKTKP